MEYDFKTIYKTFDVSYFSNDKDLLNGSLVDSQELKNYESIEKSTDDLIVILIKKFKLRISARKNRKFSKHIFICDDYKFEPEILKDDDSIKIAIVKDEFDKWGNLSDYDYIFTFKEHVKELKEFGPAFPIEDKCVFSQIKFILNNLYKRKLNKFHYFLKEVDFQRVFPKTNDYFKVFNSDYFDDEWYRDTYGLKDNTDSVIHYLLIGSEKGYDPSPDFIIEEYCECNPDVKAKGVNPLLHYERYGRKENRFVSFEDRDKRSYDLILNSEYFDKDWYVRVYELDEDVDAAEHYLHVGFLERYNPGPDFSTQEYFELNVDVKKQNMNPLVHYELSGRSGNRKVHFSDERLKDDYDLVSNSEYFDKDWYESTYGLDGFDDSVYHFLNIGYVKGYNPGPDFIIQEYFECNPDVKRHGMNPLLHYERYGRKENRFISFEEKNKRDHDLILNSEYFDKDWYVRVYELDEDVDAAEHYLHVGFLERYNPGPDFSTQEYFELNVDVKKQNMNPLVHYELSGRSGNRKVHFSDERLKDDYDLVSNSEYFDKDWYESTYGLDGFDDSVYHFLNIGYVKGYNPGPDFIIQEYFECNPDVKRHGMNPLLHYERYGRKENRIISLKYKN